MVEYRISDNDLQIIDSYNYSKHQFGSILDMIQLESPDYAVWERGKCGMKLEWATHNFCYMLHIKRSSTASVDLNYPRAWWEPVVYGICGCISWIFIK